MIGKKGGVEVVLTSSYIVKSTTWHATSGAPLFTLCTCAYWAIGATPGPVHSAQNANGYFIFAR